MERNELKKAIYNVEENVVYEDLGLEESLIRFEKTIGDFFLHKSDRNFAHRLRLRRKLDFVVARH